MQQSEAIAYVERCARARRAEAEASLRASLRAASLSDADYAEAMDRLRAEACVALAFHPDRLGGGGSTVAEGLLRDGVYRNQFETGLSSGSVSAFAGGERDEWERRLFGGAYHRGNNLPSARPKYGALFLVAHADGPAPRFGSCYFVLRPEVSARCTLTFLGSQEERAGEQVGTLGVPEPVMAALLRHVETDPAPLGVPGLGVRGLVTALGAGVPCAPPGVSSGRPGRALDSFVEAQVHGAVELARDAAGLVADASFRGHPVAETLERIAATYRIPLSWHPGYALAVEGVPETFRGFATRRLAERVAAGGRIDAPTLGAAANDSVARPDAWRVFGTPPEVRTSLRRLWHVLVLHGHPAGAPSGPG